MSSKVKIPQNMRKHARKKKTPDLGPIEKKWIFRATWRQNMVFQLKNGRAAEFFFTVLLGGVGA
jgi:hypothetical protein